MLLSIFCIYDTGVSSWMLPMFARSKGEILRWFMGTVNDPNSNFSKHPADYVLFEVGTWEDDKCKFAIHASPIRIGVAIEYLKYVPQVSQVDDTKKKQESEAR